MLVEDIVAKKNGLTEYEWADLVEKYHLDVSPDTLRKAGVGVMLADAVVRNESEGDNFVKEQTFRDLRNEVMAYRRSDARRTELANAIERAAKAMPDLRGEYEAGVSEAENKVESKAECKELVLALGDFHFGADIEVRGLRGEKMNVYNSDVFVHRLLQVAMQTELILEKEKIATMNIFLVGDLIDGMLRQSQLTRLEYGIVDQVMKLGEHLALWLKHLVRFGTQIKVYAVSGNHSEVRPLRAKSREFEDENLERIVIWYLKARLDGIDNVEICSDCERRKLVEVCGYKFMLMHGDSISGKTLTDLARDSINLYGEPIDYFVVGHLHNDAEFSVGTSPDGHSTIVRVPSLCGIDKYAQSLERGACPGATAMVIENGYGRRCVYPIKVK